VRRLADDEPYVDYVWQEPEGIARAFNLGLDHVSDGFVWFLNGRDEVHPNLNIQLFMQLLGSSKGDILVFELEFMATGDRYKRPQLWSLWPPIFWMPHPATLVQRKLFDRYGCFKTDFSIAIDGELWMRFLSNEIGVDLISIPISCFDQSGVSSTNTEQMYRDIDKVIQCNFRILFRIWLRQGLYLYQSLQRSMAAKLLRRGGDHYRR
jgi:glycosyltransferase involved in cell wall biosynthesis